MTVSAMVRRPRITDFAVQLYKQISHKQAHCSRRRSLWLCFVRKATLQTLASDFSLVVSREEKKMREANMDRFLLDRNVVLYRRLRNASTGATERRAIFKLLAEEMDDFKTSLNEQQQDKLGKSVEGQSNPVKRWH